MGRPHSAIHTRPVTQGYQRNVVPFDNHRRRLRHSSASAIHPRGVVVRLPLTAGGRAPELATDAQIATAADYGDRLTRTDYIAVFLLFLSTLTGPALVWTLLSF